MLSKAIPNLANSGKSTSLLSYDRLRSASKAQRMTSLYTRPLSRVLEYSCCTKLMTLLWPAPMKTSPSVYMIRLVKLYNYHLKIDPHSSTSALSKTSTDLMLPNVLTPSSSRVRNTSTVSSLHMDGRNHLLLFQRSLPHHCLSMQLLRFMLIRALLRTLRSMLHS